MKEIVIVDQLSSQLLSKVPVDIACVYLSFFLPGSFEKQLRADLG